MAIPAIDSSLYNLTSRGSQHHVTVNVCVFMRNRIRTGFAKNMWCTKPGRGEGDLENPERGGRGNCGESVSLTAIKNYQWRFCFTAEFFLRGGGETRPPRTPSLNSPL